MGETTTCMGNNTKEEVVEVLIELVTDETTAKSVQVKKTSIESTEMPEMLSQVTNKPKTESILIDLLTTTTTKTSSAMTSAMTTAMTSTPIDTLPQCIHNNSTSTDCLDNHVFYVVI